MGRQDVDFESSLVFLFACFFCVFLFATRARACESVYVWESFLFYQREGDRGEGNSFIISPLLPLFSLPFRSLFSAFLPTLTPRQITSFGFLSSDAGRAKGGVVFHTDNHQITYFDIVHILGKEKKGKQNNLFFIPS